MHRALYAVLALFLLNGALFGSWAARIPAFKAEFALGPDMLGLILLCLAGGAIAAFPLAGRLVDGRGPETLCKALAVAYLAALPLLALAPSALLLAVALVYFGACFGAMDVAMNAWGAEVERVRAYPLLPQLHAAFSLGAGLGAAGAALAVAGGLSPLVHFTLSSSLLALGSLPFILRGGPMADVARPEVPATAQTAASAEPRTILPRGPLVLVGLVAAAAGLSEAAVADWSAVYLTVVTQADPAVAALGFAAFSTTMVIVRLSGGWLVAWRGAVAATRVSGLLLAAGATLAVIGTTPATVLAGFALLGCGAALVMPLAFARAASDAHIAPGAAIAQVALVGYGGLLLGPPLIGFIAARSDYPTSFAVLAALGLLIAVFARALRSPS